MDMVRPGVMEADKKPDPPDMSMHPPPSTTPPPSEKYHRMAALGFIHQIGQCCLALRYSMIGWTGTLDHDKIPSALANAHFITHLNSRMDALERSLRPFLPLQDPGAQELGADHARRVGAVRGRLLGITPGVKSTRFIAPVLDEIEKDARGAGLLPEEMRGWAWSWVHGGWFRWDDGEGKWVSDRRPGIKVDYLM